MPPAEPKGSLPHAPYSPKCPYESSSEQFSLSPIYDLEIRGEEHTKDASLRRVDGATGAYAPFPRARCTVSASVSIP